MSTVEQPVVPTSKQKRRIQPRHHGTIRVWDLAEFFGVTWNQMEKELKTAGVDIRDASALLSYVAKRVIEPYLSI